MFVKIQRRTKTIRNEELMFLNRAGNVYRGKYHFFTV